MAIVAVVVAGAFVAHAASASSTVALDILSGTAAGSGNSTAGHTCPNATNTTASPTASVTQGLWP